MKTKLQKIFSIGNSVIAGLAGGAVLGSSFGTTIAIIASIAGGIIGGVTQNTINLRNFRHDKPHTIRTV